METNKYINFSFFVVVHLFVRSLFHARGANKNDGRAEVGDCRMGGGGIELVEVTRESDWRIVRILNCWEALK